MLAIVCAAITPVPPSHADSQDWTVPSGWFFSQTGGYSVVDDSAAPFWQEFEVLGGASVVGYPSSQRFKADGFTLQTMQRVVFQWRPEANKVYFLNVFDLLSQNGKDNWLFSVRQTPYPLPASFDAGKNWEQVVFGRLALLDENPAIKAAYYSVAGDPVQMNGLPTSRITDMGNHYSLRAQRVVIQQWKETVPWAAAGQVTVALGGDIAKEAGLIPAAAMAKEAMLPPGLMAINAYRAAAGAPPARINPALAAAAQNHVNYYDAHLGDPSLSGMGLHMERSGAAGFTGASMGDRARAAGYRSGAVTEDAGFGAVTTVIEWAMNTANHRLPLIHPSAVDIGYATSTTTGFTIIDVGLPPTPLAVPLPSVYPSDGAINVPRAWNGGETPDPAPGLPRPLGYPITVAFGVYQRVEWSTFALFGPDGAPLAINTPITAWMRAAAIIPHRPLLPGQRYKVSVEAKVDGKPLKKEWSFTTAP